MEKRSKSTFRSCNYANDVIFIGDFNCDLMHPEKPSMDGRDLLDLMDIYNLQSLIKSATRVGKTSETLLDIILTNNKNKMLLSGVVDVQISDHSLVYTVLRLCAPRLRSRKICVRSYKNFNQEMFLNDLSKIPFRVKEVFDEVDDKVFLFLSHCT